MTRGGRGSGGGGSGGEGGSYVPSTLEELRVLLIRTLLIALAGESAASRFLRRALMAVVVAGARVPAVKSVPRSALLGCLASGSVTGAPDNQASLPQIRLAAGDGMPDSSLALEGEGFIDCMSLPFPPSIHRIQVFSGSRFLCCTSNDCCNPLQIFRSRFLASRTCWKAALQP